MAANPYAAYRKVAVNAEQLNQRQASNITSAVMKPTEKEATKPLLDPRISTSPKTSESGSEKQANTSTAITTTSSKASHASKGYRENEVRTASPEKLTLMLYDGAIRFMNLSIEHITTEDTKEAHTSLIRAQDIFQELMKSLKMEYEVAKNLYSLYEFMTTSLETANIHKDAAPIQQVIALTKELRGTWAEAMTATRK